MQPSKRELQRRLDAERPRNHLDMRHRLAADGTRYGKLIPYAVSEQRMDDLLSSLCTDLDSAVQLVEVNRTDTEPAGRLQWEWVQLSDTDSTDDTRKLPEAENKTAKRELGVFCSSLLEVFEEELITAIREGTQTGAHDVLCSKACGIQKPVQDEL